MDSNRLPLETPRKAPAHGTLFGVDHMLMPLGEFIRYARRKGFEGSLFRPLDAVEHLEAQGIKVKYEEEA